MIITYKTKDYLCLDECPFQKYPQIMIGSLYCNHKCQYNKGRDLELKTVNCLVHEEGDIQRDRSI